MKTSHILIGTVSVTAMLLSGAWFWKTHTASATNDITMSQVSLTQAVETVLQANPGTTAIDVNLEHENNVLAWEVELNNDLEVYINANTREIIRTEQSWNIADIPFLQNWLPN